MDDILGDMMDGLYHEIDRVLLTAVKGGLALERSAVAAERRTIPAERHSPRTVPQNTREVAEQELANAEAMLRAIHESTFWRITRPLRERASLLQRRGSR